MEELNKNDYFYRECRYCKKPFISGHGNRYFCDPRTEKEGSRSCKVLYNDLKAKKRRDVTKVYDQAAYFNWKKLDDLKRIKGAFVDGDNLIKINFDFSLSTGLAQDPITNDPIPLYYNYKLLNLGNNKFKIEIHEKYAN